VKAVVWHGKRDVRVEAVPDPTIQDPTDIVIRVTSSGIAARTYICTRSSARS
jgi:threonine dehydrogenase-like Zn-dependent dehydrogenase